MDNKTITLSRAAAFVIYKVAVDITYINVDSKFSSEFITLNKLVLQDANQVILKGAKNDYTDMDISCNDDELQAYAIISALAPYTSTVTAEKSKAYSKAKADAKAKTESKTEGPKYQDDTEAVKNFDSTKEKAEAFADEVGPLIVDVLTVMGTLANRGVGMIPMKKFVDQSTHTLVMVAQQAGLVIDAMVLSDYSTQLLEWVSNLIKGIAGKLGKMVAIMIDGITDTATALADGLSKNLGSHFTVKQIVTTTASIATGFEP